LFKKGYICKFELIDIKMYFTLDAVIQKFGGKMMSLIFYKQKERRLIFLAKLKVVFF